jgi:cytochrome c556
VHLSALAAAAVIAASTGAVADEEKHELPPGPIHDRHELMEGVGANAKKIGAAAKAGKPGDAQVPAEEIAQALAKFDELAKKNEQAAMALAAVAKSGGDLKAPSGAMFQTCKACHDEFRVPKEGE